jgi:hypothetical protein
VEEEVQGRASPGPTSNRGASYGIENKIAVLHAILESVASLKLNYSAVLLNLRRFPKSLEVELLQWDSNLSEIAAREIRLPVFDEVTSTWEEGADELGDGAWEGGVESVWDNGTEDEGYRKKQTVTVAYRMPRTSIELIIAYLQTHEERFAIREKATEQDGLVAMALLLSEQLGAAEKRALRY